MKKYMEDPEHGHNYNAITKKGFVVAAGAKLDYALSARPGFADFIVTREGLVLAVAVGLAWIPTREGLNLVTAAAMEIAEAEEEELPTLETASPADAYERAIERFEPLGD